MCDAIGRLLKRPPAPEFFDCSPPPVHSFPMAYEGSKDSSGSSLPLEEPISASPSRSASQASTERPAVPRAIFLPPLQPTARQTNRSGLDHLAQLAAAHPRPPPQLYPYDVSPQNSPLYETFPLGAPFQAAVEPRSVPLFGQDLWPPFQPFDYSSYPRHSMAPPGMYSPCAASSAPPS